MFTAKNSTGSSPSLVPLGFSFSSKCARVRREMESVHVQLQLYIFISEPQLSFNWYGREKDGGQLDSEVDEAEHMHRTDAKSLPQGSYL